MLSTVPALLLHAAGASTAIILLIVCQLCHLTQEGWPLLGILPALTFHVRGAVTEEGQLLTILPTLQVHAGRVAPGGCSAILIVYCRKNGHC